MSLAYFLPLYESAGGASYLGDGASGSATAGEGFITNAAKTFLGAGTTGTAAAGNGSYVSGQTYDDVIAALSPTHRWKFDGNITDSAGSLSTSASNGTVTYTTGIIDNDSGQAGVFNGSTDITPANVGTINTGTGYAWTQRSVSFWMEADDVTTSRAIWEEGGGTNWMAIYVDGGDLYANVGESNVTGGHATASVSTGTVYHVLIVFDLTLGSNQIKIYLDGVLAGQGSSSIGSDLASHSGGIFIGNGAARDHTSTIDPWSRYDGKLQDFCYFFETALTASDASDIYDAGAGSAVTEYLGDGTSGSATSGVGFFTSDAAFLGDGTVGSATAGEGFYAVATAYLGDGAAGAASAGVGFLASSILGEGTAGSPSAGDGFFSSDLAFLGDGASGAAAAGEGFYSSVTVYLGNGTAGVNAAGEGLYTSEAAYLGDGSIGAATAGEGLYTSDLALLGDGASGAPTAGVGFYAIVTLYAADGSVGSPASGEGFYTSDAAFLGDGSAGSPSSGEGLYLSALTYLGDGASGTPSAGEGSYTSGGVAYLGDGTTGSPTRGQGFATDVEAAATGGSTPLSRRKTRVIVESEDEKRRRRAREEYEAEEAALEVALQAPEIAPDPPVELPELPSMADVLKAPVAAAEPVSAQPDTLLAEAYAAAQAAKQAELEDEEAAIMVILLAA